MLGEDKTDGVQITRMWMLKGLILNKLDISADGSCSTAIGETQAHGPHRNSANQRHFTINNLLRVLGLGLLDFE
jgi:hypothetical protein